MDEAVREFVRTRATDVCEYCRLPKAISGLLPFHIDHIRALQHRGTDDPNNLCYACSWCNLFKGPNLSSYDPETDTIVRLFNPRCDHWNEHFWFDGAVVVGATPEGRATVDLLQMNDEKRINLRSELVNAGEL
jgi:hypothetical protein